MAVNSTTITTVIINFNQEIDSNQLEQELKSLLGIDLVLRKIEGTNDFEIIFVNENQEENIKQAIKVIEIVDKCK